MREAKSSGAEPSGGGVQSWCRWSQGNMIKTEKKPALVKKAAVGLLVVSQQCMHKMTPGFPLPFSPHICILTHPLKSWEKEAQSGSETSLCWPT